MVFSSISFLFFIFPLFLIAEAPARRQNSAVWRNGILLAVSLLFYIWGEANNVFLLLGLGVLNYYGGAWLAKSTHPRLPVVLLVCANLSVLFFFKYLSWLLTIFGLSASSTPAALPLGISFFTFHAVSYIVDVYRKDIAPARSLLDFMTYFCMFPHLVAGPIVRYRQVQHELQERASGRDLFSFGMYRFLLGFNKKILIANLAAPIADTAFSAGFALNCADAWMGAAAYAVQIYFDFSAYSDMAVGLAAMAGFRFEENFLRPYSAVSIREFWRRWHISLSTWLRDYLYIPVGGSRGGQARTLFNLVLVFFLCGLWHGANVTFVVWGLWHGLFLVIERLSANSAAARSPAFVGRIYTLLVVVVSWVFFRAADLDQAVAYLAVMFNPAVGLAPTLTVFTKALAALCAGIALCLLPDNLLPRPTSHTPEAFPLSAMIIQAALFFPALGVLLGSSRNPFIYFNF